MAEIQEIISYFYNLCHRDYIYSWNLPTVKHQSGKDILWFAKGKKNNYLEQTITTPEHNSFLHLKWWAKGIKIYVNNQLVQVGDLFDQKCRISLTPLQTHLLSLVLDSPDHDEGALIQSVLAIENNYFALWQDLQLIDIYLSTKADQQVLQELKLWFSSDRSLNQLQALHKQLISLAKYYVPQHRVYLLGNSHIDIAWLWTISETKQVLQQTFHSVLQLQTRYSELIFNQSSAVTYQWIEEAHPELFYQISSAVATGKWEITGGMWVEPDCNIPSGESLIRQILYGKKYFQEKFGKPIKVAWLPDSFGFNWQLPQILVKSGFDFFVTQKLSWNDTNKFPYQIFYWQGLDGTRIFTYFTNPIGEDIDPVAIARYLVTQNNDILWLFGVGDHGGGPTADMLETAKQWQASPLCPSVTHGSMYDFLKQLSQTVDPSSLPIWEDELYLEFHRGTYTSKADQKLKNRRAEIQLITLEKLFTLFKLLKLYDHLAYPKEQLDRAWRSLLVNQFHDIVTGSAIPEVFEDADQHWQEIDTIYETLLQNLQEPTANQLLVCNLCNWTRNEIISLPIDLPSQPLEITVNNRSLPYQIIGNTVYLPISIPAFSAVAVQWRSPSNLSSFSLPKLSCTELANSWQIENQFLIVIISKETGYISQITDKRYGHQLLSSPIHWKFYQDQGQYWDAWNIDPHYESYHLSPAKLTSLAVQSAGSLLVQVTASYQFQSSHIRQEIEMDCFNPWITVRNAVDWQESHVLAKVVFPVSFTTDYSTYEIPMGVIQRSTQGSAKWEVPAQYWADISNQHMGLAVINDCKYGYSAKLDRLCLTALRSPEWPCPHSDRGMHRFSYRLVPHRGSWQNAQIVHLAQQFNVPLLILRTNLDQAQFASSILTISSSNVILSCWKQSYDQQAWVMRLYEAYGYHSTATISFVEQLKLHSVAVCDLMEHSLENVAVDHSSNCLVINFCPYEIKTLRLTFKS